MPISIDKFYYFLSHIIIRNFRGTCSYNEMPKGCICKRMFGNTCPKPKPRQLTVNESVCCFGWFTVSFSDLRGNKWNGMLA